MDIQSFLEGLLIFILGVAIGGKLVSIWMRTVFAELIKELDITPEQLRAVMIRNGIDPASITAEPPAAVLEIRVEKHQGVLFAYRTDTEEFLGQGANQDDLVKSIASRMRDVRLVISENNGAELLQKNNA
jgi:uncharacterized protein YneF (UPF0154 family)